MTHRVKKRNCRLTFELDQRWQNYLDSKEGLSQNREIKKALTEYLDRHDRKSKVNQTKGDN